LGVQLPVEDLSGQTLRKGLQLFVQGLFEGMLHRGCLFGVVDLHQEDTKGKKLNPGILRGLGVFRGESFSPGH
jgi:hypothetical protein